MFQIGDLVEIDYPYYEIKSGEIDQYFKTLNESKRFGIVLSSPMDSVDTNGKIYKNQVCTVYDVEQMIIYDRIGCAYLTSMM